MKNFKKTLSVILAAAMVLSTMSIIAFAHTSTWTEDPTTVNLKYEVKQVPSVTMNDGTGTYTAVDNDIYAVTVYAKAPALTGIIYLQIPFQYDVNYFEPVMTMDGGDLYCAYDGWFSDIGITDVCYSLPERYSDTNAYDKDGNVSTSSLKIKCYGLGHASAGALAVSSYYYGKDDPASTAMKAYAGLGDDIRLCALTLDDGSLIAKTAYLNAVNGLIPTDWVDMGTMYFHRVEGVSEAEAVGQVIGIADGDNFGTQLSTRRTTDAQPAGYLVGHTNPTYQANYVSNAVVAVPAVTGPVVAKNKAEVRFTYDTATDNGVADEFKLRIKSVVTAADWDAYFANTEDDAATTNKITAVGMVAFPTNEEFVEETALAAISAGASANYKAAKTDYIQKASNDSDAYFGAIINIKHSTCADGLNYIGFVQYLDASGAEQVIFYEAGAEFANVGSANYDTLVNTFKTQYPA